MTVPYPLDAFDHGSPVRRKRLIVDTGKLTDKFTGVAITISVHAVILALALTAVHVARPRVMQELSVRITPEKSKAVEPVTPIPNLAAPTIVTAPLPEVSVQTTTPPPVAAQPPLVAPAPSVAVPAPQKAAGETRDS